MLVMIVSCQKNRHLWPSLLNKGIDNIIILCGGSDKLFLHENVLFLPCNDNYDGLSEKIMCALEYIINNSAFSSFSHVFKADDHDTDVMGAQIKELESQHTEILENNDYIGQNFVLPHGCGRFHHIGKVPQESPWYGKEFTEDVVPYLGGGQTYILSRRSMQYLVENKEKASKYGSYEDVMVGFILRENNIVPFQLNYGIRTWWG